MLLDLLKRLAAKAFNTAYLNARESIGAPKRTLIVRHVEQACSGLQETQHEFQDALAQLKALTGAAATPLDQRYHLLNRRYQVCRAKSEHVSAKIRAIERVAEALFLEWERELNEYSSRALRTNSRHQLKLARQNYARLIKALQGAEKKIQPVLAALNDQVLYLKHNLNARAIVALRQEFIEIGLDISQLIQVMEHTIAEANAFLTLFIEQKALPGNH